MKRMVFAVMMAALCSAPLSVSADGKVMPPRNYTGSLEERSQEAIIIFHHGEDNTATEDLILKIQVHGDAKKFAWIIPFPNPPKVEEESAKLFNELFRYVEYRKRPRYKRSFGSKSADKKAAPAGANSVQVLSREVVGDFDVAVVRETEEGGLNPWLKKEGFQELKDADDVLDFYRKKKYVFACIKVTREAIDKAKTKDKSKVTKPSKSPFPRRRRKQGNSMDTHPLRFTFKTGGTDSAYFPMKLTGLQKDRFDVNLYVFYRYWLNDHVSKFGYEHRGFRLKYRDFDTRQCVANGGKSYSLPTRDPFLKNAPLMPELTKLFQKLHPGNKYYLTNIQARNLDPASVREWKDDLWLFPYYTNPEMIPQDVLQEGVASSAFPDVAQVSADSTYSQNHRPENGMLYAIAIPCAVIIGLIAGATGFWLLQRGGDREAKELKPKP